MYILFVKLLQVILLYSLVWKPLPEIGEIRVLRKERDGARVRMNSKRRKPGGQVTCSEDVGWLLPCNESIGSVYPFT